MKYYLNSKTVRATPNTVIFNYRTRNRIFQTNKPQINKRAPN